MLPPNQLDPSVIERAPDETPEAERQLIPEQEQDLWKLIGEIQVRLAAYQAENEELNAKVDLATEKAKLVKPYANKVFWFLCHYSLGVFVILLLAGYHAGGFTLDTTVLSIIVGSTAVSAIGLVHTVVRGLFGPIGKT